MGITGESEQFFPTFYVAAGIDTIAKDEDDMPYCNLSGNERFFNVCAKIWDDFKTEGVYWDSRTKKMPGGTGVDARIDFFRNGHALFSSGGVQEMISLRDMPDDFGVIPFPKADVQQSRYYSRIEAGRPFIIPITNQRPDIAGAVMEAMACETHNSVFPAYYEFALKNKFARDPDTCEMLDLIRATSTYELGDTIYVENVRQPLTSVFSGKNNTLASWVEKNEEKVNTAVTKIAEAMINAY